MGAIRLFVFILTFSFISAFGWAESMYDRRLPDGRYVYNVLLDRGLPEEPLALIFQLFDHNRGRIPNTDFAVLVDYSQISTEKRLHLLNLRNAEVESFHVSHGIRTGILEARAFSNIPDSWKSSLGFFYANGSYVSGKNGLSLYLYGIDRSNSNAKDRTIVLHGAPYVSEDFILRYGRLGWSEGCFAVSHQVVHQLVQILKRGSVLLSYHRELMAAARNYPAEQSLSGYEVVPPGVYKKRTPGEGGGINLQ
jgi:hypothetical protein